ncbi:hypothetical protein F4803DRAFT_570483 [Xylaria telfairii]|nr:hypothetical protein F4803DRAFT_570483 [Xylaria telfairii]
MESFHRFFSRGAGQEDKGSNPLPNQRPKRYLTLRVNQVPLDSTRESFENTLKSIATPNPVLYEAVNTLSHVTLVRMNKHSACATVTVHTSLSNDELFDSDFYGITPLYDHEHDTHTDLIAVTGLGGHALGSWKSPTSNEVWLREYLPKDVPNQRVIIYGYNTKLQGARSKQSIGDLGARFMESITRFRADTETSQRPIIFIGHSLGGLLIKEALIHSSRTPKNVFNIHQACYGMLFFGVPNLGLRYDQLLTIVQGKPNRALIESLVVDRDSEPSEYLRRITDQFSPDFEGKYVIISIFERSYSPTIKVHADGTLSKTGEPSLLVTKESTTKIGVVPAGKEDNIPFDTDHSGLVKYEHRGHEHYRIVRGRLEEVVADAKIKTSELFAEKKGTCTWLHSHRSFKEWASGQRALLWIKGKPGSGKSTLLKYALATEQNKVATESKNLIISFFFNGRGDELQKTRLGFYRSLLYQLLQKFPGELPGLIDTFIERKKTFGAPGDYWHWHEEELRGFLEASLPKILEVFSITLFVDALDEAGEESAIRLVNEFKMLVKRLTQSPVRFAICFSCRHYPILEANSESTDGSTILVERMYTTDIEKYVKSTLHELPSSEDYVSLIMSRAAGIFLWAHLVVKQVLELERKGKGHRAIQQVIDKIPQNLNDLYQRLVENVEERATTLRLMQWICCATRPLISPNELRWAMAIDPNIQYKTAQECRDTVDFMEEDRVSIRIKALSCGLAEITQSSIGTAQSSFGFIQPSTESIPSSTGAVHSSIGTDPQFLNGSVQFIHSSVKDFLIKGGLAILAGDFN